MRYKNKLIEAGKEILEGTTDNVKESIEDFVQKTKEYLGLAVPDDVGKVSIGINPETDKAAIEELFKQVYQDAGGRRVIGWT